MVRNATSSITAPSVSILPDYTKRGVTIRDEGIAECLKSGFIHLLTRGCDLGYWGFAPAPTLTRSADPARSLFSES